MAKKKIVILILWVIIGLILSFIATGYLVISIGGDKTTDIITEEISIILPKSEQFKVTSTAKGDNQYKVARLGEDVFTFYLDNAEAVDASSRGNDKTMQLIHIKQDGTFLIFDAIPVWMHGNVLVNPNLNNIYYTTYEEDFVDNVYYSQVKIYTYHFEEGEIEQTDVTILNDDRLNPWEANPRVGADIDLGGNIAVVYGDYAGVMHVHVYDAANQTWLKHSIEHYHDTYINDSNLYPYVQIEGLDCIRIVASRDTATLIDQSRVDNPLRDYARYFAYDGDAWSHEIIADYREVTESTGKASSVGPTALMIDAEHQAHIITKEDGTFHYYLIPINGAKEELSLFSVGVENLIQMIRMVTVDGYRYLVVAGDGLKGFKMTGYVEVYDYETHKLLYRNTGICHVPYLYLAHDNDSSYIDMEIISRDSNYADNSETHYIRLKITR